MSNEIEEDFQNFLYETFFVDHPGNYWLAENMKSQIIDGSYYKYNLNDNIVVLALNTLPYNSAQDKELTMAERQWDWFEEEIEFAAASGKKVIVLTHIFAGATIVRNDDGEKEVHGHWKDEWTQRYFSLMRQYSDTILIEVGGHDHWASLRAI